MSIQLNWNLSKHRRCAVIKRKHVEIHDHSWCVYNKYKFILFGGVLLVRELFESIFKMLI
jgi:hypothetical protein